MLIWTLLQLMSLSWPLRKNEKRSIVIGGDGGADKKLDELGHEAKAVPILKRTQPS